MGILVGRNYCIQTNLQATGILDHLSIAHEVKCLRESVKKFEVQTIPSLREDIISKINEVPENVKTTIMENFVVDGVNPVNMSDIQRTISESKSEILARVTQIEINSSEVPQNLVKEKDIGNRFELFSWGGKLRMIP